MQAEIFGYTIVIERTKTKRKTGYSSRAWTDSEVHTLIRFHNEGKSTEEIAELLHRTKPAIYNMLNKLKHQ